MAGVCNENEITLSGSIFVRMMSIEGHTHNLKSAVKEDVYESLARRLSFVERYQSTLEVRMESLFILYQDLSDHLQKLSFKQKS